MRRIQFAMCGAMLGLQSVVLLLTTPVMLTLTDVETGVALAIGGGLTVACILAAGMIRRPGGMAFGWGIQVVSIAMGFIITEMFVLGVLFLALFAGSYVLGAKIDRERAERALLE